MEIPDQYQLLFRDRQMVKKVLLAVAPVDRYTGAFPTENTPVFIKKPLPVIEAVRNLTGYYIFSRLPEGAFEISVISGNYFNAALSIGPAQRKQLNPRNPVVTIPLEPLPSYPFPPGTTLVRGLVHDKAGNAVGNAAVTVAGMKETHHTTARGEFVIYFNGLTEEDIQVEGSEKWVALGGDAALRLKARHQKAAGTAVIKNVREGKTTSLEKPIVLSTKK
jgi:hypothetical protein